LVEVSDWGRLEEATGLSWTVERVVVEFLEKYPS
jgi:hypothetical protein